VCVTVCGAVCVAVCVVVCVEVEPVTSMSENNHHSAMVSTCSTKLIAV